ncbi:MAG: hypothetical protein AB4372_32040 [Xenococcus sp. (in: cyanobacteria)]
MTNSTQLTPEEIQQYRDKLEDKTKALEDIDLIEKCNGDLEYAAIRLARRSNIETVKADENSFWEKVKIQARQLVCKNTVKDDLAPNILGGLVGLFTTSGSPILGVVATPLAIHIVRETLENFCD